MKEISEYKKYQIITIPDANSVNCIYLNSTLLHCCKEEFPNSAKVFACKIDYPRIELKNKEFNKVDRFLSCRSLLFTKRKIYSILSSRYFTNLALAIKTPPPIHSSSQPPVIKIDNSNSNSNIEQTNNKEISNNKIKTVENENNKK